MGARPLTKSRIIQPGSFRTCNLCNASLVGRGETARFCDKCRLIRRKEVSERSHAERKEELYRARRLGLPVIARPPRRKLDPEYIAAASRVTPSFCVHLLDGMGLTAEERISFEYEDDHGQIFMKCKTCYLAELEA